MHVWDILNSSMKADYIRKSSPEPFIFVAELSSNICDLTFQPPTPTHKI
jgi:hypothetical protein